MKYKFLDGTFALAVLSALLFTMGYSYDVSRLSSFHLPIPEFLPPTYLEVAQPFRLLFVIGISKFFYFRWVSIGIAGIGVAAMIWPRFRARLVRMHVYLSRVPSSIYLLSGAFGFIALCNWLTNYGWTTADREYALIAEHDWDDWTITLKDHSVISGHFAATSGNHYAVIVHEHDKVFVQMVPKGFVSKIEHDRDKN